MAVAPLASQWCRSITSPLVRCYATGVNCWPVTATRPMMVVMSTTDNAAPAGQGRLARVLATRGGKAAPEAPFVIEHREALIYMLCQAAELEHAIMCQYLFAAFSLKQQDS